MKIDTIIAGRRKNGEVVYFCGSHTNGPFWCSNAQSMAKGFTSNGEAEAKIDELKPKFTWLQLEHYQRCKADQ